MNQDRERLIDFLLGELSPEKAREVAQNSDTQETERYREALAVLRAAAAEGWEAPRRRLHVLRFGIAAAAVLAVALTLFLANGNAGSRTLYEPDGAYGYLRPEETDSTGAVRIASSGATETTCTLRTGHVDIAALGSDRSYSIRPGAVIPTDSEIASTAETGVRIDLAHGGILFLGPVSTVQLRRRKDGETALRLVEGVACTVVGDRPIHLAVDRTDLLLDQLSGAAFARRSPAEVVNLRGDIRLLHGTNRRFTIPVGDRLPAACADNPQTVRVTEVELSLDWYRELVYSSHRVEDLAWESPGRSTPLTRIDPKTLVYLRLVPQAAGEIEIAFGGEARVFKVRRNCELELRLALRDLGPGSTLTVRPASAIRAARLFQAVPR